MKVGGWFSQKGYKKALDYYNCGMYPQAAEEFTGILEDLRRRNQDCREVLFYLAECYMTMGNEKLEAHDLKGAITDYEKGLSLKVGFADLHYRAGRGYFLLGDLDKAADGFKSALRINPGYIDARFALAETYVERGDVDLAVSEFHALKDRCHPTDKEQYSEAIQSLENGQRKKGVAILAKIFQNVANRSKVLYLKGIACYQASDYPGAIRWFQELLEEHPRFADVHNLLGVAWCSQECYEEGIESFLQAIAVNPNFIDPRLNLAFLYEKMDQEVEAILAFREVLRVEPQNVIAVESLRRLERKEQVEQHVRNS